MFFEGLGGIVGGGGVGGVVLGLGGIRGSGGIDWDETVLGRGWI